MVRRLRFEALALSQLLMVESLCATKMLVRPSAKTCIQAIAISSRLSLYNADAMAMLGSNVLVV